MNLQYNVNQNKKILLALVDENKIEKINLNKSFESNVPFVFYWDLFNDIIVKAYKNYWNRFEFPTVVETKFGLIYNQQDHTVELIRDDIKLDILIQNIDPGLKPAVEIHIEHCRIQFPGMNIKKNFLIMNCIFV